jgi:hypothetical protein
MIQEVGPESANNLAIIGSSALELKYLLLYTKKSSQAIYSA